MDRFASLLLLALAVPGVAMASDGPMAEPPAAVRPPPRDQVFPGVIQLAVDATDTDHKLLRVQETVPVPTGRPMVLLYPQWETASHAPTASASAIAGLEITAAGRPVAWRRDPLDPFAFRVDPPPGAVSLKIAFQYVSPTRPGTLTMTPDLVALPWQDAVLYPAGWYARDIPVQASVRLPAGLEAASSLDVQARTGTGVEYAPVPLETLVDSPVYAGRWTHRVELGGMDGASIHMDLLADTAAALVPSPDFQAGMRALVQQTGRVFGPPHFRDYDFLVSLSDLLPSDGGTEHLRSSENNFGPDYLLHPDQHLLQQDLLAHEFVHSWNGRFRIPAGLWTPDLNTPSNDDLLWVYEGETQYWGVVLAARAGLRTPQQTLDLLALTAAGAEVRKGRAWKSLADSALDPVYDAGHGVTWPDWQGREDYYVDGVLLWLDVDTLIRQRSGGRRSLDDFARAVYGVDGHSEVPRTYTLADLCAALDRVVPMDWSGFFAERLHAHDDHHLLDGLQRGGYRLVYADTPTETSRQAEAEEGGLDLRTSLGLLVGDKGGVRRIAWDSPAFRAGLGPGARLTSLYGAPYSDAALLAALRGPAVPLRLGFRQDGKDRTATLDHPGPPRYPRLERTATDASLDQVLKARP